ncbi:fimbrial protein [Erwinia psidii]|uniref:Fimbrial protein n=1 Tax=Erwinia psidii TaxID=69224 RepID=A0A3N6UM96_9GAMM|nr:fimbrial protein [Erwinia psidii]MCX8958059.1 fimbrial protein [Erwinia psidii]MCX8963866.1 fimbrial protein [Erwinia psidii]RQM37039.1 fimbrial protein [Erwinia psidii]
MSIFLKILLPIVGYFFLLMPVSAVNVSSSGSGSNSFLLIENGVDNEFFITPSSLDPRFSGANIWTRYSTNQVSLAYIGYVGWAYANRYFDMWISDSPIIRPFEGIRCMTSGSACPSSGRVQADVTDDEGFYHARSGSSVYNGSYGFASLSSAAFEYFRTMSVGESKALTLNLCYTNTNYDYASGVKCRDLASGATWRQYTSTLTKVGHLSLKSTGAASEIWIASDGTPGTNGNTDLCYTAVVSNVSGMVCKMVSYQLQQTQVVTSLLRFSMIIDTATLGFSPSASEVRFSGNGSSWQNYSASASAYSNFFSVGDGYIYVFFANSFFSKILNSGKDLTNKDELFTFYFNNSVNPESGYYQFTASNQINIIPKEYGISIISSDGASFSKGSGKIGSESPIEFSYRVTTSASRQADSITAQVTGDSTIINGTAYCVFTSTDGSFSVPVPAYLSWVSASGATQTRRNSCGEDAVDMTSANWVQTAWNAVVDDGYFYTTTLKLLFPMDNSRSQFTVDGADWLGTVSASGEVRVTATWVGVDR